MCANKSVERDCNILNKSNQLISKFANSTFGLHYIVRVKCKFANNGSDSCYDQELPIDAEQGLLHQLPWDCDTTKFIARWVCTCHMVVPSCFAHGYRIPAGLSIVVHSHQRQELEMRHGRAMRAGSSQQIGLNE